METNSIIESNTKASLNNITLEPLYLELNNRKASTELIATIQSIILSMSSSSSDSSPKTKQTINAQLPHLAPLLNSKDLNEVKINLTTFTFNFFKNITHYAKSALAFKQIKTIVTYFHELKEKHLLIIEHYPKDISTLLSIFPSFQPDFITIFEYNDFLLVNVSSIALYINNLLLKNNMKLSTITQYIIKLTSYMNKQNKNNISMQMLNEINHNALFEMFFNNDSFYKNIDELSHLLSLYPKDTERAVNVFLCNHKAKYISKLLIKNKQWMQYITNETMDSLIKIDKEGTFNFHYARFVDNKTYLIYVYDIFKEEPYIIDKLCNHLIKDGYEKQAQLIKENKYTEVDDIQFEENKALALLSSKINSIIEYIKLDLPKDRVLMISKEEDLDNLNHFIDSEYIGIDSEEGIKITIFNDEEKQECAILQIANKDYVAIIDIVQLKSNQAFLMKFSQVFKGKTFIAFGFSSDMIALPIELKHFFIKDSIVIDITNTYEKKYKKKCPELKTLCYELFNKELNKNNQISNWKIRPLRNRQIEYAALDAYILLSIYKLLTQ